MTDIQTVLLSQLNRSLVGSDLARDIDDVLIERFRVAKQTYRNMTQSQINARVEQQRHELLTKISMLQSETFFKVSSDGALSKMIPNILIPYLIDQGAAAYEARSAQDLRVLEVNLQQFQTVLDKAIGRTEQRSRARGYGIMGCIGALFAIAGLVWYGNAAGIDKGWIIPILSVPVTVTLWSLIGSLAAMLYRFNKASEMDEPLRWLFTRPVTGMVMGTIVYLLIKGTLILSSSGIPINSLGAQEVMWLIAFLAGFSDRFCDFVLNLVVGRLAGVAMESQPQPASGRDNWTTASTRRTMQLIEEQARDRDNALMTMVAPRPRKAAKASRKRAKPKAKAPSQPNEIDPSQLPMSPLSGDGPSNHSDDYDR